MSKDWKRRSRPQLPKPNLPKRSSRPVRTYGANHPDWEPHHERGTYMPGVSGPRDRFAHPVKQRTWVEATCQWTCSRCHGTILVGDRVVREGKGAWFHYPQCTDAEVDLGEGRPASATGKALPEPLRKNRHEGAACVVCGRQIERDQEAIEYRDGWTHWVCGQRSPADSTET